MARQAHPERPQSAAYGRVLLAGLLWALALGLAAGWLRYWVGLFVLAQGAVCGLLLAYLAGRAGRGQGQGPAHPGPGPALAAAFVWLLAFWLGQGLGYGLAQPWFDAAGWLGRVWQGKSSEFLFGVAATGPVHRAFSLGAKGGWWLVFNLIDWLIMFFFLWTMPWRTGRGRPARPRPGEAAS
ncbi:MAG: hypothetical protein C4525_11455 [Desulfarculus sp.]|nr:MAG: hypothetical protein C4525_11455 [Desulfarculus sp.]